MFNLIQNIILGVSLAAPIGPVNIEVVKRGLRDGFWPAFLLSLGAASADTTYLLVIYFGLSNFITIPIVKTVIWFSGSVVLLYIGFLSTKEFFGKVDLQKPNPKTNRRSYLTGYFIAMSNPLTIVWWLGVFGAIVGSSIQNNSKAAALLNSLTIIIGVILWFFILSLLLHWGKRFINEKSMRYISLISGIAILGFGIYFLYNAVFFLF